MPPIGAAAILDGMAERRYDDTEIAAIFRAATEGTPPPAREDPHNLDSGHAPRVLFAHGNDFPRPPNHDRVMGDNTGNSLDSRFFGDVDADYIIGKQFFVYWPLTKRFGWGNR